ncbi:MAG: glycosyltransferase family 2 protein [Actinobacteria bacterium]|nr:glycosyltransferase family 2 protein [Actinomycetota bacterium]
MRAAVVIPTLNGCGVLSEALASLESQTVPVEVVVVDNASSDGTVEMLRARFPQVTAVRNAHNEGFGRAVNRGVAEAAEPDVIILVNNDAVCAPDFVERMLAPFADPGVGMVAGVLLQGSAPELVDTAGIELDCTLRSWDMLWNRPVGELEGAASPVGPCGGAAAYRAEPFKELGGFDESLFAYWEDVDLALRFRLAGWRCVRAPGARALHRHGATLGAASPAQRRLEAFGRGYVLAKYRVGTGRPATRLKVAVLDVPVLIVHLVFRRELDPLRERLRGRRAGLARPPLRAPLELADVTFCEALRRQANVLLLRFARRLPAHFAEHESPLA